MHFHLVETVLEGVGHAHGGMRELPLFADRHEPGGELMGDGAAKDESAGLDAGHVVHVGAGPGLH